MLALNASSDASGNGRGDRTCKSRWGNGISTPFSLNFLTIAQLISDRTFRCCLGLSIHTHRRMFHAESPNPMW